VIAWLRTLSDSPVAEPSAAEIAAEKKELTPAAPAEGAAATDESKKPADEQASPQGNNAVKKDASASAAKDLKDAKIKNPSEAAPEQGGTPAPPPKEDQ
jgi:hypothetical protein